MIKSEVKICDIQPKFAFKTSTTLAQYVRQWMYNIIKC